MTPCLSSYLRSGSANRQSTNPLGSQCKVSLAQLESQRFIELTRGKTLRLIVDQLFASRRIPRVIAFQLSDEPTAVQFVEAGLGIATMPSALGRFYAIVSEDSRALKRLPCLAGWSPSCVAHPDQRKADSILPVSFSMQWEVVHIGNRRDYLPS